jgi:glycosyltransferase involved in cell wall biosynthesis
MNSPLRLLVTTSDLVGRGSEREIANLLAWLPRDRFKISLCLWRDVFEYPCPADVPVTILDKTEPWHIIRTIDRLARHIDKEKPDVVFSQLNYVNTATGFSLIRARHRPAWIPRFAGNPQVEIRWPVLPWTRQSLKRATRVAGCSPSVAGSISKHLFVPTNKTISLPNVVDGNAIEQASLNSCPVDRPADKKVIVTVGGLVDQKDHFLLIDAFADLQRPDAELWIVGKGNGLDVERRRAAQRGIATQVRWLGFQSNPHVIVRAADLFVLSSRYEGLPNALLEAMIIGTPVVSTDCRFGPADLIEPGQTGWLVPVQDRSSLSAAMKEAIDHPAEARRRAELARDRIGKRFHSPKVVEEYATCFESLSPRDEFTLSARRPAG